MVTIHLSRAALEKGVLYKYDAVNDQWMDYSDYAEFSPNHKEVYLTLKDGGFGDVDGIENGIIVDPLTVAGASSGGGDGDSGVTSAVDFVEGILPEALCFISTATQQPGGGLNIWSEIRGRELAILFAIILLGYVVRLVLARKKIYHGKSRNLTEDAMDWILF